MDKDSNIYGTTHFYTPIHTHSPESFIRHHKKLCFESVGIKNKTSRITVI